MTNEQRQNSISIPQMEKIIKSQCKPPSLLPYSIDDTLIESVVTPTIGKKDKVRFIFDIVKGCFDEDVYQPCYKSDLIKIAILMYFTNLDMQATEDTLYALVNTTDVVDKVKQLIPANQLFEIETAIEDMIVFRKEEILYTQKKELAHSIKTLEHYSEEFAKIGEQFQTIDMDKMKSVLTMGTKNR